MNEEANKCDNWCDGLDFWEVLSPFGMEWFANWFTCLGIKARLLFNNRNTFSNLLALTGI